MTKLAWIVHQQFTHLGIGFKGHEKVNRVKHNNYAKVSDQYFWRQTEKMAVNLSVTPEQAAMLIPLLQQISSSNGGTPPRITSDYDRVCNMKNQLPSFGKLVLVLGRT